MPSCLVLSFRRIAGAEAVPRNLPFLPSPFKYEELGIAFFALRACGMDSLSSGRRCPSPRPF